MAVNRLERYWEKTEAEGSTTSVSRLAPPLPDEPPARSNPWFGGLADLLAEHPQATVIAGITMGVVLGWLIKRR